MNARQKVRWNPIAALATGVLLTVPVACDDLPTASSTVESPGPLNPTGDKGSDGATTGSVSVHTATTGPDRDPDGYALMVDGQPGPAIGTNATRSLDELPEGDHSFELLDVAANCSVVGANPQTVSVEAGDTTVVTYDVACEAVSGSILVTTYTTSTGTDLDLDADGYEVWLDGVKARNKHRDGTLKLTGVEPGNHEIELRQVDSNCAVTTDNPVAVTVTEGVSTEVRFDIECAFVLREILFAYNGDLVVMTAEGTSQRKLAAGRQSASGNGWTQPAWSPDGSKIVLGPEFWCWSNCNIELLDVAHGTVTKLTDSGFNDQPAWSPDGSKIAFTYTRSGWAASEFDGIKVMNPDGSNVVSLVDGGGHPAWSPDGSKLAFTSNRDGNFEIYVTGTDGQQKWTRLTFDPGFDGEPAWSPDGSRIAFTSSRDGNAEVYVMDADGSNPVRLTFHPGFDGDPDWSSDGSRIVFNHWSNIWLMNADGSGQTALTAVNNGSLLAWPDWLP